MFCSTVCLFSTNSTQISQLSLTPPPPPSLPRVTTRSRSGPLSGKRACINNPSDCIANIMGCMGYWWEVGMGERYGGEEDMVATSTAILARSNITTVYSDRKRIQCSFRMQEKMNIHNGRCPNPPTPGPCTAPPGAVCQSPGNGASRPHVRGDASASYTVHTA